jgi:mono/diheme cytochrome c family protein
MALQLSSIIVSRVEWRRLWETAPKYGGASDDKYASDDMRVTEVIERRRHQRFTDRRPCISASLAAFLALATLAGCDVERRKSDAELGLNPQQAHGRRIYDNYCDRCHRPYSTKGKKGPGLKGVFEHPYLPLSGLPANDERVGEIIRYGRHEMPGYSQTLSAQDMQDLLAYLHTL